MRVAPWAIAAGVAVALGLSGSVYMVRADGDDHHTGNMHGQGMGDMAGLMSGMDMDGMGMDPATMDEMHASMAEQHEAMGGIEAHDAMHSTMAATMAGAGGAGEHHQHHRGE